MTKYAFVPTANDLQNTHLARKNHTETKISKHPIQWDIYMYTTNTGTSVMQLNIERNLQ